MNATIHQEILKHWREEPWKHYTSFELAHAMKFTPEKTRQYLSEMQTKKLVKKTGRKRVGMFTRGYTRASTEWELVDAD
jgi:Mn-dependent DtxR family transcriptional regulator